MSTLTQISITFCQKVCIQIPSNNCNASSYSFVNDTPSIISLASNGSSAIIFGIYNVTGTGLVTVFDGSITIGLIYVTVTGLVNPIDNFVYSTHVSGTSGSSSGTITNVSTIPGITNPSNVVFTFSATNNPSPSGSAINYSYLNNISYIVPFGLIPATAITDAFLLVLQNYPSSSLFNALPVAGIITQPIQPNSVNQYFLIESTPCSITNMVSFVQLGNISNGLILASTPASSSTIQVQLSTTSGISSPLTFNYFLASSGYVNLAASSGLVYCDSIPYPFENTNSGFGEAIIALNLPNTITPTNYTWFFQIQSSSTPVNLLSYSFFSYQNNALVSYTSTTSATYNVGIFAFINQSAGSMTII